MRGGSRRPDQVAETVRQVLADALLRGEVRDPRVGLVTITSVEVTNDLSHAKLRIAVPAPEEGESPETAAAEGEKVLQGLRSAAGFLRSKVARALATRVVPELHFELDRGLEHASRINEILEAIRREEAGGAPEGSGEGPGS